MKTFLATIGLFFAIMMLAGVLKIGHFRMYFGADETVRCVSHPVPAGSRQPLEKS